MEYEEAISEYREKNYRIYFTDERSWDSLAYYLFSIGLKKKAIVRTFDVLVFPDKTIREVEPRLKKVAGTLYVVAEASFDKGKFTGKTFRLGPESVGAIPPEVKGK